MRHSLRLTALATLVAVAALAAISPTPVHGASFTVNATHDAIDAAPGDGTCADATGACTLRAAVMETNALPGGDEITLPAGTYVLGIAGRGEDGSAAGDLDVMGDLSISGAGPEVTAIDGAGLDRVITVRSGLVSISGTTIRGGVVGPFQSPASECAFALHGGGGICNLGELRLSDATIMANLSSDHGGGIVNSSTARLNVTHTRMKGNVSGLAGGAIFNTGVAAILQVLVMDNSAGTDGGGIASAEDRANPGALMNTASSVVSHNVAGNSGGGISNSSAVLTVSESLIAGNRATFAGGVGSGGGGLGGPASLVLSRSTVTENTAHDLGGGLIADNGTTVNSTISANVATRAGGVLGGAGSFSIVSSSITANNSQGVAAGLASFGGVSLLNAIVGANLGGPDCSGPVESLGHNLDSDGSCALTSPGDLSNLDPLIGPLADNGGPTQTHALLFGSPAVDAGDDLDCPATDQRGVVRPVDGNGDGVASCDIGAFELVPGIEILRDFVAGLPASDFKNESRQAWMLRTIDDAGALEAAGNMAGSIDELLTLERRVDGCGTVADPNDWIANCAAQLDVRGLLRAVIAALHT